MVTVFLYGFFAASQIALTVNTTVSYVAYWVTRDISFVQTFTRVFFTPFFEELVKGAVFYGVYKFYPLEIRSARDGVVYGVLVGLGFAMAENIWYTKSALKYSGLAGLFLIAMPRYVLTPMLHSLITAITGMGFSRSGVFLTRRLGLFFLLAVFVHSINNTLSVYPAAGIPLVLFRWIGFIVMLGMIHYVLWDRQRVLERELKVEADEGVITPECYVIMSSVRRFLVERLKSICLLRRDRGRLLDLCGRLALSKQRLGEGGSEGLDAEVEFLRGEIRGMWHVI